MNSPKITQDTINRLLPAEIATTHSTPLENETSDPLPAAPAAASPALTPHPLSVTAATGFITGYIYQWRTLVPYQGVSVQAHSAGGGICPDYECPPVSSNLTGFYNVTAPVGNDYVEFDLSGNVTNYTYVTVYNATTTYAPPTYMVPDGIGIGYVRGNTTSFPVVQGATACAVSRDQSIHALPCGVTDSYGYYLTFLPPAPSILTITPQAGYLDDFLFVNATPHFPGDPIINLGTVYLTHLVKVTMNVFDAVTRGQISGTDMAMRVCSSITNSCQIQGNTVTGNPVWGMGVPGPSYVEVYVQGYLYDVKSIGNVSKEDPGKTFNAGSVYVVPTASFTFTVGLTTNATPYSGLWATGLWYGTVQSMNGYLTNVPTPAPIFGGGVNMSTTSQIIVGCAGVNQNPGALAAFPGLNDIVVTPDITGQCGNGVPMWPTPPDVPAYKNESWFNATPYTETTSLAGGPGAQADWINLTVGFYVYGHVYTQGTTFAPRNFTVTSQSTESLSYQSYAFGWQYTESGTSWSEKSSAWACSGRPSNDNTSFCVPVPPGDFTLSVSASDPPGGQYDQNFTWAFVHNICCNGSQEKKGIDLSIAGNEHSENINVSYLSGRVAGYLLRNSSNVGLAFPIVTVCPASGVTTPGITCSSAPVSANGSFLVPAAPKGWDYLTAGASGFTSNTIWFNVNNTTGVTQVGNISVNPKATIDGFVTDATGSPLFEADVSLCALNTQGSCQTLGIGQTTTNGYYNGTTDGGWLPFTTYEILATAPGYSTDFTFINATAGVTTHVPTLVLHLIGVTNPLAPAKTTPYGVWVSGTVLDQATKDGIDAATISACSAGGGTCYAFTPQTNSLGQFNDSVLPGIYIATVQAAGYSTATFEFNVTEAGYDNLGNIYLTSNPWVTGNAFVNPWGPNITVKYNGRTEMPLGPTAVAQACSSDRTECGLGIPVSTDGSFNVSAPSGIYDSVTITPNGQIFSSEAEASALSANTSTFNTSGYVTTLNASIPLDAAASVAGFVMDASARDPHTGLPGAEPARYADVAITTLGPNHATLTYTTNSGGFYDFFVPAGPNASSVSVDGNMMLTNGQGWLNNTLLLPGGSYFLNESGRENISVGHFGYVAFYLLNSVTDAGVQYLGLQATMNDLLNGTLYSNHGTTNGDGFVNISIAAGPVVTVAGGGVQNYNTTSFSTSANASQTSYPGAPEPYVSEPYGAVFLDPWGFVRSFEVNNTTQPVIPTLLDQANHRALPGVQVTVASTDSVYGSGASQPSNWQGQFFSNAPIGPSDIFTATRYAYLTNTSRLKVDAGSMTVLGSVNLTGTVNLTGDGIVAGSVVGLPGDVPISGATLKLCSPKGTCYTATTNGSGVFWVLGAPGIDTATASADGYVTNSSATTKTAVCSDCWQWMGRIELNAYAFVSGTIRQLPSGLTLSGSSVSLCSPLGDPVGPCGFSNVTGANGQFLLEAPAGSYVLEANASNYNATYRPIALSPGEHLFVGTIFLAEFGSLAGSVFDSVTLAPVYGAQVYACPKWSGGTCTDPVSTRSDGSYGLSAAPGPYTLTIAAPNYADAYVSATVASGMAAAVAPVLLVPLGVDVTFPVSGTVVNASNPAQGIAGATVSLTVGNGHAISAETNSKGQFSMNPVYGTYTMHVSANGYHPTSRTLVVIAPVSGISVALSIMTFNVTGVAHDGLNGQPLSGVVLNELVGGNFTAPRFADTPLGDTASDGSFAFALPNGTHEIEATYHGPLDVAYGALWFSIVTNGAGSTHNLALYPATVLVHGTVVSALSGVALPNAPVTVVGTAADGVPISQTVASDGSGSFTVYLPQGSYQANASYDGYGPKSIAFAAAPPGAPLTLALSPNGASSHSPSASNGWLVLGIVLGVLAAVLVLGGLWVMAGRRRRARRQAPAPKRGTAARGGVP